jgi:hypothetical protein
VGTLPRLWASGLSLTVRSGGLTVAPRSALTDELRDYIRTHKAAILTELDRMCSACASNDPKQCTRRTGSQDWSSCWAKSYPDLPS